MQLEKNFYDNLSIPYFILCKANGDRIGSIKCTSKKLKKNFNDYNEISFTTYLYYNNIKNELYDKINELQYIEILDVGRFIIGTVQIYSEGTEIEYKECVSLIEEITLAQKYL